MAASRCHQAGPATSRRHGSGLWDEVEQLLRADQRRLTARWLGATAAAAIALDAVFERSVLAGDPRLYNLRADEILDGHLPYVDAEFEHLPLMIPVILAGRALTAIMPGQNAALAYALMMTAVIAAATRWVVAAGARLGHDDAWRRWVLVAGPMLPIVLFRLDAVPTALAAAAVLSWLNERPRASAGWSLAGALAKAWPLVTSVLWWADGRRRLAIASVASFAAVAAALLATPGFREGRDYDGVHTETLAGSAALLWRNLTGADLQLIEAAWSIYIDVPGWAPAVHVAVAGVVVGLAARTWRRRGPGAAPLLGCCGALVAAAIVGGPLLSSQFVFWLAPFVALTGSRRTVIVAVAVGTISTVLLVQWQLDTVWWSALAFTRAVGVVALGVMLACEPTADETPPAPTRSRSASHSVS